MPARAASPRTCIWATRRTSDGRPPSSAAGSAIAPRTRASSYGDLDWQADQGRPVGINPPGATIDGHNVDGVLPDDLRRAGGFTWPPPRENYVYEALQGALLQAELLSRAGYPAYDWSNRAMLRGLHLAAQLGRLPGRGR